MKLINRTITEGLKFLPLHLSHLSTKWEEIKLNNNFPCDVIPVETSKKDGSIVYELPSGDWINEKYLVFKPKNYNEENNKYR